MIDRLRTVWQQIEPTTKGGAVWWIIVMVALFVVSLAVAVWLVAQIPATYFIDRRPQGWWADRHPILRWSAKILKNLCGAMLVGLGVLMLFTPGQGIVTLLIGIMLLDFPGKRQLEFKLIRRPRILKTINRLRATFGKPPLIVERKAAARGDS